MMEDIGEIPVSELTFAGRESGKQRRIVVERGEVLGVTGKIKAGQLLSLDGTYLTDLQEFRY